MLSSVVVFKHTL